MGVFFEKGGGGCMDEQGLLDGMGWVVKDVRKEGWMEWRMRINEQNGCGRWMGEKVGRCR